MRKLKLDLDGLQVESFETLKAPAAKRGTVRGAADTLACVMDWWTMDTLFDCTYTMPPETRECIPVSALCSGLPLQGGTC